jgi:hypothetical protein
MSFLQDDIYDICSKKHLYNSWDEITEEELDASDRIFKERDPRMPSLGTRVKRGPDWQWNNQDNYGPGTVIGHLKDSMCMSQHYVLHALYS